MRKKKSLIIITGGIASGKSFVSRIFEENKFPVFDTDKMARELLHDKEILKEISSDLNLQKTVDFEQLKQMIFDNSSVLDTIEKVLYPVIFIKRDAWIQQVLQNNHSCVVEIPLLFEKCLDIALKATYCDKYSVIIISLICDLRQRMNRAKQRNHNLTNKMLNIIVARQCNDEERLAKSDFVIYTCYSQNYTIKQTKCFIDFHNKKND